MSKQIQRWVRLLAATLWLAAITIPPASAVPPPVVPPGPPPAGPVGPPDPTERKSACGIGGVVPQTDFRMQPSADSLLDITGAWQFSRGAGQKVAVIDTGVNRHPRLPALVGGGDYVSGTDGLEDCDAHGTLVAGIIAAAPSPNDAFAGVAPEATILSIRQNSDVYAVKGSPAAQNDPNSVSPGYGNIHTLALAHCPGSRSGSDGDQHVGGRLCACGRWLERRGARLGAPIRLRAQCSGGRRRRKPPTAGAVWQPGTRFVTRICRWRKAGNPFRRS